MVSNNTHVSPNTGIQGKCLAQSQNHLQCGIEVCDISIIYIAANLFQHYSYNV